MNHILNISTAMSFASHRQRLNWAKRNLDKEIYEKIEKSYKDTLRYTIVVTLILGIAYFIAILMADSGSNSVRSEYTWKLGHVSEDTVWYIDNEKYETSLFDYGYNPIDFSNGDYFRVYLDENKNIVKITPEEEVNKMSEDGEIIAIVMVGGPVLMILILLCIHLPIAGKTYGRLWREYGIWYEKADLTKDIFCLK